MTLPSAVLLAATPPAASDGHPSLYETVVAVVIAVLVVLYFDERVRAAMTLPQRGRAIGYLGGILTLGIFVPVMALAGFIPDTARIREFTVAVLLLFLTAAFGVAMSAWGREDGRRPREEHAVAAMPPVPPVPAPSPRLSERERAAEVLGYSFFAVAQIAAVLQVLTRAEPPAGADLARAQEYLRRWSVRWTELGPALAVIITGYPSPQVRENTRVFLDAASRLLSLTLTLAGFGEPPDAEAREKLPSSAHDEFEAAAAAQQEILSALHPEDGTPTPVPPRRPRAAADGRAGFRGAAPARYRTASARLNRASPRQARPTSPRRSQLAEPSSPEK